MPVLKIEDTHNETKKLNQLKEGEIFRHNGDLYIKTDEQGDGGEVKVVNLRDGILTELGFYLDVHPVSATLTTN